MTNEFGNLLEVAQRFDQREQVAIFRDCLANLHEEAEREGTVTLDDFDIFLRAAMEGHGR